MPTKPLIIATRGSALALAQANLILAQCRAAFPDQAFELRIIKTTGDKLQTASLAQENKTLPKGLFTKELEVALLDQSADLAVHSLKDLPTELPTGLKLGAVGQREDVRDVLIYRAANFVTHHASRFTQNQRGFPPHLKVKHLPAGSVIATGSTRRKAQLLAHHGGLKIVDIRGNVATRMRKLMDQPELDATVLALAGLTRLNFKITADGKILGNDVPAGLLAVILDTDVMLPCVGQAAIGIEIRDQDERLGKICTKLNHPDTFHCVTAERAFLAAMGGGCQSPVAAHAQIIGDQIQMRAVSFLHNPAQHAEAKRSRTEAGELGVQLAAALK